MEEKILKIIEKNIVTYHCDLKAKGIPVAAKEIAEHMTKFIEWVAANCVKLWNKADVYQEIETHKTFKGIEKLYQYWLKIKEI